jgi:hypothetical protein
MAFIQTSTVIKSVLSLNILLATTERISNFWASFICNVLGNRFVNYVSSTNLQGPSWKGECPKTSDSLGQQFPGSLKITILYFAMLLHCTRNASCVEQMTIILSYTDMEKGYNGEHFVGFITIDKTTPIMSL